MYKLPCEEKFAAFGAPSESSLDLGWFSQGVFRLFVLLHTGVFRVGDFLLSNTWNGAVWVF